MRALLVFIDGLGYGRPGPQNPFDGAPVSLLGKCSDARRDGDPRVVYASLDATLGHVGLPQSATGQATLFTGEDAMKVAGGHRSGYPTRAVAELVLAESFLGRARAAGKRAGFLNAFDPEGAERLERRVNGDCTQAPTTRAQRHRKPSASTLAALARGGRLRTFDDAREGRAATFDLTGEVCAGWGLECPRVSVEQAARAVARGAAELDVALFEMFLTDRAGHSQDINWARLEIVKTEHFLSALIHAVDPEEQLVIVTSDHGNIEDLSTRSHTRAPVPLIASGRGAEAFISNMATLADVAPKLLELC